ncbi:MAG: glycosyltransferase family 4 protein [Prevotella sp.]|nr:glycosyltransferase family 4 protein [Prevotella sp.]
MKILYCNPVFFEYRLPFYKELKRLFNNNFYVMYSPMRMRICGKDGFADKVKEELGDNALPLLSDHVFDTYSMGFDRMPDIERGKRIPFTFGLMRAIRKVKPDVLITEGYFQWTPLVLLYGMLHRIPVYLGYERTLHTERNTGKLKILQRKLFNKFLAGFLVNGQETKHYLESLGVPSEKIHIGGMSADASFLQSGIVSMSLDEKETFKQQYQPNRDGLTFLFVGQIVERKGVRYLLEAWRKHILSNPSDRLLLVGSGNQLEEFRRQYKDDTSINLTGRVEYENVYKFYAIADVFIIPTIEDNWSLVIPEAMACGLPVSTSIYNGCHVELVHKDENGITFDPYKEDTLVEALDYFHHQDLKVMGQKSIELEKEFNTENCARRVYDALTNKLKR